MCILFYFMYLNWLLLALFKRKDEKYNLKKLSFLSRKNIRTV